MESNKSLLYAMCETAGVHEPSQLNAPAKLLLVYAGLSELTDDGYSFYEWSDAVCYITDRSLPFRSKDEAVRYLSMYIRSKAGIGRGRPRV